MRNPLGWLERLLLYGPERSYRGTPEHLDMDYEDVFLETSDSIRIHSWLIRGPEKLVFLIFHGNGGNISVRLDQYRDLNNRLGASVLAVDYRGYGQSDGTPSEDGLYEDARTSLEYVNRELPDSKIVVFGRSLGSAVASNLAQNNPQIDALILEAGLSSIQQVMFEYSPWTKYSPVRFILRANYPTLEHVKNIRCPVLILHGTADSTVSHGNSKRIFAAANEPKQLELIEGGDHDFLDQVNPEKYYESITSFLQSYVQHDVSLKQISES
ncbi:MAG: alpha/beta hydrolase [Dehalococcoidia bacterium]